MDSSKVKKWWCILPVLSIALFILIWILLSIQPNSMIPTPKSTWLKFLDINIHPISQSILIGHVWASLKRVLIAFVFAILLGVLLGVGLGWNKTFRAIINPVFELLRPIPPIAWIPLIILWFGIGELPKIVIVFIGSFVSIVLNTYAGIKDIDPLIINAGRVLGANKRQLLFEVALPATIPAILAGIRTALSSGWMCVVAAEMIAARKGVGFLIVQGQQSGDTALIVACMLVIGVVSMLMSTFLSKMEGVLCPWQFGKTK
jgi:taurine transport system permease protein